MFMFMLICYALFSAIFPTGSDPLNFLFQTFKYLKVIWKI